MNDLLRKKLVTIQKELQKESTSLKSIFLSRRSEKEIRSRNSRQIVEEWKVELATLKKHKMKDSTEMISYIIEVDFALRDLFFILRK